MPARPGALGLAALALFALLLSGCAAAVAGHGTLAAGAKALPGGGAVGNRTGAPPATTLPGDGGGGADGGATAGPTGSSDPGDSSGSGDSGDSNKMCRVFSAADLQKIFGAPVTVKSAGSDLSCDFETATNGGVLIQIFDSLDLTGQISRAPGGKNIVVAGHPAYQGDRQVLVAQGPDASGKGVVIARNLFFDNAAAGDKAMLSLLARIVPAFPAG